MKRLALVVVIGFAFSMGSVAQARSTYLSNFNSKYGTATTRLDTCDTCHLPGGKTRNPFGQDVEARLLAGSTIQQALTTVEPFDSDGDTFANLDEILALAFPGNAADMPGTPPPPTYCVDADADGYAVCDGSCTLAAGDQCGDCNDASANVNPGVTELCSDGLDNNCDTRIDAADPICAPAALSDYDIASVRPTGSIGVGRRATFKVNVLQVVAGTASLSVSVTEGGVTIPLGTSNNLVAGTYSYAYTPTMKGTLTWTATITDQDPDADVATGITVVK